MLLYLALHHLEGQDAARHGFSFTGTETTERLDKGRVRSVVHACRHSSARTEALTSSGSNPDTRPSICPNVIPEHAGRFGIHPASYWQSDKMRVNLQRAGTKNFSRTGNSGATSRVESVRRKFGALGLPTAYRVS